MKAIQISEAIPVACWNCSSAVVGAEFCPACRRIQPLPAGVDFFAVLGLPRKLKLDVDALEQRFHQLSWSLHPDNFVRSDDFERQLSLDRSSQLNDAFRTLRDPVARIEYLLALYGMRKEGQTKQQAPPELLAEVFALNESLDELRSIRRAGGGPQEMTSLRQQLVTAEQEFESKLASTDAELDAISVEWDRAFDAGTDELDRQQRMARMNEILNRRAYIRNLVENVKKELAPGEGEGAEG